MALNYRLHDDLENLSYDELVTVPAMVPVDNGGRNVRIRLNLAHGFVSFWETIESTIGSIPRDLPMHCYDLVDPESCTEEICISPEDADKFLKWCADQEGWMMKNQSALVLSPWIY